MKQVDYLIIGQGLAGSCLALQLLQRNKTVVVFDTPAANISTRIAAGLFNPVTGRKMSKTWMADTLFPYLFKFYKSAEQLTGSKFFYEMPIYRPFISFEEQNEWMANSADLSYAAYIEKISTQALFEDQAHNKYGGVLLKQCGYLDTTTFMLAVKNFLISQDAYRETYLETFHFTESTSSIHCDDISARELIFCNGVQTSESPAFSWLPFRPLKGETLSIRTQFKPQVIFNRGVYVVPEQETGLMKVGATYEKHHLHAQVTDTAREELRKNLEQLIKFGYEIVDQSWGLRPATADRRPFLGQHPKNPKLWVFNGLGTKGVSLAPYFSAQLADRITGVAGLSKEVNIERYYSLY